MFLSLLSTLQLSRAVTRNARAFFQPSAMASQYIAITQLCLAQFAT